MILWEAPEEQLIEVEAAEKRPIEIGVAERRVFQEEVIDEWPNVV